MLVAERAGSRMRDVHGPRTRSLDPDPWKFQSPRAVGGVDDVY